MLLLFVSDLHTNFTVKFVLHFHLQTYVLVSLQEVLNVLRLAIFRLFPETLQFVQKQPINYVLVYGHHRVPKLITRRQGLNNVFTHFIGEYVVPQSTVDNSTFLRPYSCSLRIGVTQPRTASHTVYKQ